MARRRTVPPIRRGAVPHRKQTGMVRKQAGVLQSVEQTRGWFRMVQEPFSGAWQRNIVATTEDVLSYAAVYSCVTLIASDIAKLRIKLVEKRADGIWQEIENAAHSPVLRKPNRFQD